MKEVARELGVSEATIYTWKSKYGGLEVSEARRLKELEDENRRLKHMVADLSLDKGSIENGDPKKRLELVGRRQDVALVMSECHYSEREACKLMELDRSSYRYRPRADHQCGTAPGTDRAGATEAALRLPAIVCPTRTSRMPNQPTTGLSGLQPGTSGRPTVEAKRLVRPAPEGSLLSRANQE